VQSKIFTQKIRRDRRTSPAATEVPAPPNNSPEPSVETAPNRSQPLAPTPTASRCHPELRARVDALEAELKVQKDLDRAEENRNLSTARDQP
jgi:hypothetical protein